MNKEVEEQIKEDEKRIDKNCPLCRLYHLGEIRTKLYHKDRLCIIVECESSHVPMLVSRFHEREPNKSELNHMVNLLITFSKTQEWKEKGWGYVDFTNHVISDHFHVHLR